MTGPYHLGSTIAVLPRLMNFVSCYSVCVRRLAQEAKALMVPTVEDVFHADTLSTDDYLGEIQSMTILTAIQVRSAQRRQLLQQAGATAPVATAIAEVTAVTTGAVLC